MKIAVILNAAPLDISCDVDKFGRLRKQRLVNVLSDNDIHAITTTLTIGEEVDVFTVGKNSNPSLLRSALAYGAKNACHIGGTDWPEDPLPAVKAEAIALTLSQEYPLVIISDNGSSTRGNEISAYLAKALRLPAFTSVSRVEKEGDCLRLLRKLEKGKRQVIKTGIPALIALLPTQNWTAPPSLEQNIKAEESPLALRNISYYGLMRKTTRPAGMNISWRPLPLCPASQEVYHPLSGFHPKKRLEQLMQGSTTSRNAVKVGGTPEECAQRIVSFLKEKNLIKAK